eukprot:TRINITY_DN5202_c0_g1_i1.p1 TRINITY_DN5202_c0_g1~~TRINITY_DN5202_c0_g1_i1.p1  ORF type:complete len:307 (-),score=47.50 TRINITY_DN5202_c0_g1_i1:78-998(-)
MSSVLNTMNALAMGSLWVVSYMCKSGTLAQQSIGGVSDMYLTKFTPAHYTFRLWPVIYITFTAMIIWSLLPAQRNNSYIHDKLGWLFFWKMIGMQAWLLLWCNLYIWASVFVILFEWTLANIIYQRISIHYGNQGRTRMINNTCGSVTLRPISTTEFWILQTPFSLFFGWGTVVAISNILAGVIKEEMASNARLGGLSSSSWDTSEWSSEVVILLTITTMGTLIVLYTRCDFFVAFSVAWGWIGIGVKHMDDFTVGLAAFSYACLLILAGTYCVYFVNDQWKHAHTYAIKEKSELFPVKQTISNLL